LRDVKEAGLYIELSQNLLLFFNEAWAVVQTMSQKGSFNHKTYSSLSLLERMLNPIQVPVMLEVC